MIILVKTAWLYDSRLQSSDAIGLNFVQIFQDHPVDKNISTVVSREWI